MHSIETAVQGIKDGKKDDFEDIILAYQKKLFQYCFHMLGSIQEAEDAVQDVFLMAYRKIHSYVAGTSFQAWIYKIAHNHCINRIKRNRLILFISFPKEPIADIQMYEMKIFENEFSEQVSKALLKLSPIDRSIFILRVVEDRSYEELEICLNLKQATLRKKFERARKKLYNVLQKMQAQENGYLPNMEV